MSDDVRTRYGWCECNAAFITKIKPVALGAVPDRIASSAAADKLAVTGYG